MSLVSAAHSILTAKRVHLSGKVYAKIEFGGPRIAPGKVVESPSSLSMSEDISGQTPNKRKRLSTAEGDDVPSKNNTMHKSPNFWFDDGNLILEVENTRYRVHKNVLSRHSSVFFDMLKVAQPETMADEANEEAQVVRLYDSANDWDHFLGILYDPFKWVKLIF